MSTGTISERYADASKESEYEAVLAIIHTALSRVRQAKKPTFWPRPCQATLQHIERQAN